MTPQLGQPKLADLHAPWRRAQQAAGIAFGLGFVASVASTGVCFANADFYPERLAAVIVGLACGLVGASVAYVATELFCHARRHSTDRTARKGGPVSGRKPSEGEDIVLPLLFVVLLLTVGLVAILKHGY